MHLLNPDLGGIMNPRGNSVLKKKKKTQKTKNPNPKNKNPQTKTSFTTNYIRKP